MRVFAVLALFAALALPAAAASLQETLARFAANDFSETAKAIDEIAESGAPQAASLIDALLNRRLAVTPDGGVFFTDAQGRAFDALTGSPVAAVPKGAQLVRTNNKLRGQIENSLGTLRLQAPDPAKRREAAEIVLRARDVSALPAVRTALSREQDPVIAKVLRETEAALVLSRPDATTEQKTLAISILRARSDQDAIAALRAATAGAPFAIAQEARRAIVAIEKRLEVQAAMQNVWYGLSLGSVLLLAAIGLAITFGVMGVINMAHGEMVMLGAYTTFVVQEVFRAYAPGAFDFSLLVALPLAFLVAGLVGIAIERGIIRFLYGRPLETLLATWGVSLILQQAVRTAFGPTNREVGNPSFMSGAFDLWGLQITYGRLWIVVFTLVVFAGLLLLLKATSFGLRMRAVTQNRRMAASMGIPTARVDALTFGLGSGIAGIAGVALSQIDNVSPNLGQSYIIDSFMVVVFGGVGSLWGTFVSAFALGIANKLMEPVAGAVLAKIVILVLLILFIQKRPRGLFALKGRAVES
ncbi:urea ABC transporter permease subunit UrtB [Blastochloris sulfoviridis]|uniref:Urea ABC transporter permease subunit UrtB n=1 Tax=Blastochloris sulfoviridis TaxID=50712 RepID=A0A5M6I2H5_9HYPH|nr:urea ABC transporter permease subunit UrtB [Blastochloris sulfoviridis]KAA5602404.1 urea ABC transporter permease subunit UrtB [Blastochloris sulfoviridis]